MENTNPLENPVSKNEFNGFWIPRHNAKVMKQGFENNKAPFLPDASGNIKENEKGVFYNFKDEQGEIHTASLFFAEQTQNPEDFIQKSQERLKGTVQFPDVSMAIASSEPEVTIPDLNCILGDKLTAFAPHTTGIPLGVGKDVEVLKQMYDVASLILIISPKS